MRKYELFKENPTDELYRIRYLIDIPRYHVKAGDLGGYVENEYNLSQNGDCVIIHKARVYGDCRISGNALVCNKAVLEGYVKMFGNAIIGDHAYVNGYGSGIIISGNACITDDACLKGEGIITDEAEIFENAFIEGYFNIGAMQ